MPVGDADQEVEFQGTARFAVVTRLGAGAMGDVYEVFDRERHTRVALKRLRRLAPEALLRFKNEFRALESLEHPNLVLGGELIEDAGEWFFTMELVPGEDFLAHVRPGDPRDAGADDFSTARTFDAVQGIAVVGAALGGAPVVAGVPPLGERRPAAFDEARLRACMAQLASAVAALHGAGKVHRDIKPTNIRVAPDHRLTLLDLGLVLDLGRDTLPDRQIAGTADYMAPEQAAAREVGPAADWYAVGVLLYQALTGGLPFAGPPLDVMAGKQRVEPPAPRLLVDGVPADLDRLCGALLRIDPAARPTDRQVLDALQVATARATAALSAPVTAPFVGRAAELSRLAAALAGLEARGGVTVLVEGESGVGKSVLVERFTEQLTFTARAARTPPPLVLAGRCHEREAVPYKALDGVIDALSRALTRMEPAELATLLPASMGLLAQVFPVLRQLEAAAPRAAAFTAPKDTGERRDLLFRGLRQLLTRLAAGRPLVIVIDDLQWADADSLALLRHLLAPPAPPRLLLLATVRTTIDAADGIARGLALPGAVHRLPLGGLTGDDARTLAGHLLAGNHGAAAAEAGERIAAEAAGHPLFMSELVRYAASHPHAPLAAVRLEQALWARIIRLDPAVRRLLELVAVAGAPLRQDIAARAADAGDATTFARWISTLRAAHLAKTTGAGDGDLVEPYHDRVREAVRLHIADEARAICHRRIAVALQSMLGGDAESLAVHWQGAGDRRQAALYASTAAQQATDALAFDRAARLLAMAIELTPAADPERVTLLTRAGEALVHAGHGGEAAERYLEAARLASPEGALELRRRAAEQFLRNGHIAAGNATLAEVLSAIGMRLAPTPARALASLLATRARVWLRGHRFEEHPERDVPQAVLTRIDTCWSVAAGLAMVDTIRGADFQARQLLLALEAGEPYRVCRALAVEASFRAATSGLRAGTALLAEADAIAARLDDPRGAAIATLSRGLATYLDGQWRASVPLLEGAASQMSAHCTDLGWEHYNARFYALLALLWTGDIGEACRRISMLRMEAATRGDRYASATLANGMCVIHSLYLDDPEGGLQMARRVVEDLPAFQFQHYWEMVAGSYCHLYRGDGASALALIDDRWQPSERSMFFRIPYIRIEALLLRGRACVAAAVRASARADRPRLLARARRDARRLARERLPYARPLGLSIEAGIALVEGDTVRGAALLEQAAAGYATAGMELFRQASEHLLGRIAGGVDGDARRVAAERWMLDQGIAAPARMARAFAPSFDRPS